MSNGFHHRRGASRLAAALLVLVGSSAARAGDFYVVGPDGPAATFSVVGDELHDDAGSVVGSRDASGWTLGGVLLPTNFGGGRSSEFVDGAGATRWIESVTEYQRDTQAAVALFVVGGASGFVAFWFLYSLLRVRSVMYV